MICKRGRGVIAKHDDLAKVLANYASKAGFSNIREKRFRFTRKKPADVFVTEWRTRENVAWDVGVASVTRSDVVGTAAETCGFAAVNYRHTKLKNFGNLKNKEPFKDFHYVPIIAESGGSWEENAVNMLRRLGFFLRDEKRIERHSRHMGIAATLSVTLQRWNGRMICSRFENA